MILKKASKIKDFFEKYLNFFDAEEEKGVKERKKRDKKHVSKIILKLRKR